MKNNPIEITNYIKDEFSEFILSTYTVDDENYKDQLKQELKSTDLFQGPYLHTVLPFAKGTNLNQLIREGVVSREFYKLHSVNLERPLYLHQEQAIRKAAQGRNLVVTTGTGSGKTESFLYPILNHILKTIESGTYQPGVKAIFLYPMNALVNDQKDRIRQLLKDYPKITFGSYTGDTPEKKTNAVVNRIQNIEEVELTPNELISRKEMRDNPPDLLFTNYSMLEYLMIRPNDYSILKPTSMRNWQFMVLDEAHTYKGTLGIEISMLLKRLMGTAEKKPQFILTSATLGDSNSTGDIIKFAENLTSVFYGQEDVIFGTREEFQHVIRYEIAPEVYEQLKENLKNPDSIRKIVSQYVDVPASLQVENMLYRLLKQDRNVERLLRIIDHTNQYIKIYEAMNKEVSINHQELTALIQLISLANEDNCSLYDAKFHMFVSAPNKAFITIGPQKEIKFGTRTRIHDLKAFEVGVCKNCNHLYILGNIRDDILEPNEDVDVYENYDEEVDAQIDYFVLEEQKDSDAIVEYRVCAKCGNIYAADQVNCHECSCGEKYRVPIWKVTHTTKQNNLTECVCCGQTNTRGIINSFHLNKDTATSVLSEIFYEGMGETAVSVEEEEEIEDLFSLSPKKTNPVVPETKQLLAFSDSRQQASYFSVLFQYNHERYLRRRIIWEQVKEQDSINVKELATQLTRQIKAGSLFDCNSDEAEQQAWISILSDLLYTEGVRGPEGVGLYNYRYRIPSDAMERLKKSEPAIQKKIGLNLEEFIALLNLTIDRFRKHGVLDYSIANLTDTEKKDAFPFTSIEHYVVNKKQSKETSYSSKLTDSFLPVNATNINVHMDYLMRVLNCSREEAVTILDMVWALMVNTGILKPMSVDAEKKYQVSAEQFTVEPYTKKKWYICNKCRKITPYNIRNVCPEHECKGQLVECNPEEVFAEDYYRREYVGKQMEKIVVREHTAQLDKETARDYQKQFKQKKINILSSSTTFEMGVDIGSLENVFLRNVPPSPANYVQRAGRAGRSKESSALVVTYCGNTSHDFSYFNQPEALIDGQIDPPLFNVSNEKIVIRHILASAFSFYFRKNPDMFRDFSDFVLDDNMKDFKAFIGAKPKKLGEFVDESILKGLDLQYLAGFGWVNEVMSDDSKLNRFLNEMSDRLKTFNDAYNTAKQKDNLSDINYFNRQIHQMEKESVVSMLSEYAVIPKYGFPVDVVNLDVVSGVGVDSTLNLQRDLTIAISEYAPESEIIVDGNKYISRYINIPRGGSLEKHFYSICAKCEQMNESLTPFTEDSRCINCGSSLELTRQSFVIPDLGFSTDKNAKASRYARPKKTYAGAVKYIGGGIEEDQTFNYHDLVLITTIRNDQLVVMNEHNFYYCPDCGYSVIKQQYKAPSFTSTKNHLRRFGSKCENKVLSRTALGHIFKTDVIRLHFTEHYSHAAMVTLTYALIEGMSHALQIERNDINGLVIPNKVNGCDIVLYDNVPGGAGHVRRMTEEATFYRVLCASLQIVSQNCCDPETTCYRCLRNYYNQAYHTIMKRQYAIDILKEFLLEEER